MKFLKGLGVTLLSILIFVFIFVLTLSFIFKNIMQKQIVTATIKGVVTGEYISESNLSEEDKERLNSLEKRIGSKDINKLIDILLKEYENSVDNQNYVVSDESVDEILDLCVKHIDLINEFSKEKITESDIRSAETRKNLQDGFSESLHDKEFNDELSIKTIVRSYNLFVSTTFRLIMIFSIVFCAALIGLIRMSYYKWLRPVGIVTIISGFFISLIYVGLTFLVRGFENAEKVNISLNVNGVLIVGIVEVVIGIIFIITTGILNAKFDPENNPKIKKDFLEEKEEV